MKALKYDLFEEMYKQAYDSPRKRTHHNLHSSFEEKVQRLLIALIKGSYVEPHFHRASHQWENFFLLNGVVRFNLYHDSGMIKKSVLVGEGQSVQAIEVLPGEIHSVECVSDRALMLEIKEGPFNPEQAKDFPIWRLG